MSIQLSILIKIDEGPWSI